MKMNEQDGAKIEATKDCPFLVSGGVRLWWVEYRVNCA
jgi:hypothetical protein